MGENAPVAAAVGGVAASTALVANPSLQLTGINGVPPGNAPPGSAGGGATPSAVGAGAANPSILATALTLVPLGLTPIAVFPPYNTPRQIPAISVIFSEDPDIRV